MFIDKTWNILIIPRIDICWYLYIYSIMRKYIKHYTLKISSKQRTNNYFLNKKMSRWKYFNYFDEIIKWKLLNVHSFCSKNFIAFIAKNYVAIDKY